ncbi:MAG TPA: choice-of-anchor J domain-containing protein, partial [Ferruginibacter sp.]|nr:choice-of-anchor J domain-containing protein [Ferruginibacter sp.]
LEAAGYAFGSCPFTIMVSTNYNGSNTPSASTWTTLMTINASTPTTGYATLSTVGPINLSAYIGQNVYIAFKYDGGDPTRTTTYEIDDVKVTAN